MYSVCILIHVSIYPCINIATKSTHGISGLAAGGASEQFEVRLKMTMEWTQRWTWRPWSSKVGDKLGGRDPATLEMHFEADITCIERWNWRPWSSKFGDALRGWDRVNSEMPLDAMIGWVWRRSWRRRSSELRDALAGRNWGSLEMHLETTIVQTWRQRLSEFGDGLGGHDRVTLDEELEVADGRCAECYDSTHPYVRVTCNRGNVMRWLNLQGLIESRLMAVDLVRRHASRCSYIQGQLAILRMKGTDNVGWILYSVYTVFR